MLWLIMSNQICRIDEYSNLNSQNFHQMSLTLGFIVKYNDISYKVTSKENSLYVHFVFL